MPTGAELVNLILNGGLTGRAVAGLQPPEALAAFGGVQTPPFVPQQPTLTPQLPATMPNIQPPASLTGPQFEPIPYAPEQPVDYASALERAKAAAGGILGPEQAATPEKQPGILGTLLQILSQGVTAGLSKNPSEVLADYQRQAAATKQQRAAEIRADKERRQQLTAQIFGSEIASQRQEKAARARDETEANRDFQNYVNRQREILGDQAYRANEAELTRIYNEKRDAETERRNDEKQKALFDQQMKIQRGRLRKDFLDQGAGNYADELADYALGQRDTLSPGAEKANRLIQAKIERLQRSGRDGGNKIMTWAELSDGSVVPSDKVKLDVLPPGVTVKRLFSTGGGLGTGTAVAGGGIEQKIQAAIAQKVDPAKIIAAIRQDAPQQAEALIQKYGLAPTAAPTGGSMFTNTGPPGIGSVLGQIGGPLANVMTSLTTGKAKPKPEPTPPPKRQPFDYIQR